MKSWTPLFARRPISGNRVVTGIRNSTAQRCVVEFLLECSRKALRRLEGKADSDRFAQRFEAEACRPSIVSNFIVVDTVTKRVWRHAIYEHQ